MTDRQWLTQDGEFLFGKHAGDRVEDVAKEDPGYLRWVLENAEDICEEDQESIEVHLRWRGRL